MEGVEYLASVENLWRWDDGTAGPLTFQVAGLRVAEADGQVLQALGQRGHHVPEEAVLLLGAVAAARLQAGDRALAAVEHLQGGGARA